MGESPLLEERMKNIVLVYGESGSGKTKFIESMHEIFPDIPELLGIEDTYMTMSFSSPEEAFKTVALKSLGKNLVVEHYETKPCPRMMALADVCISIGHFNYQQRFACIKKRRNGPSGQIAKFLINEDGKPVLGSVTP